MAGRFSTAIFAEPIAKRRMCVNVKGSAAEGSQGKNAPIAVEHQPGTRNSNGVFRVTAHHLALAASRMANRVKKTVLAAQTTG